MKCMATMEKLLSYNIINTCNNSLYDIWDMIKYIFSLLISFFGHFIKKNVKILQWCFLKSKSRLLNTYDEI